MPLRPTWRTRPSSANRTPDWRAGAGSGASWVLVAATFAIWLAYVSTTLEHSFAPTDDGYILAMAWRLWHGEVPHRDFVSVRPALSAVLHSLWFVLPERLVFPAARAFFWLQMLGGPIAAWMLSRPGATGRSAQQTIAGGLVILGAAVFAIHTFPPMPWHTVDGITLSILGAAFLTTAEHRDSHRWAYIALVGVLLGAAPLAKQNFFVVPVFTATALLLRSFRLPSPSVHRMQFARFVAWALVPGIAYLCWLTWAGAAPAFFGQLKAVSRGGDVFRSAIMPYLAGGQVLRTVVAVTTGAATARILDRSPARHASVCAWAAVTLAIGVAGVSTLAELSPSVWTTGSLLLLPACAGWLLASGHRGDLTSWTLLVTAWASQISWGFPWPTLGVGALGVAVVRTLPWHRACRLALVAASAALATAALLTASISGYMNSPYQDAPRAQQTHDAAEIFPRLGRHLQVGPETYARLRDVRDAVERAAAVAPGSPWVVLPDHPLIYFLTARKNPTSLDWWNRNETGGEESRLRSELAQPDLVVVLEVRDPGRCDSVRNGTDMERFALTKRQHLPIDRTCLLLGPAVARP